MLAGMGAGQGPRIEARRKALELSQVQLAKLVGVSRAAVQKWEAADDMQISRDNMRKLARVLRCQEAHITDGAPITATKDKPAAQPPPLDLELLEDVVFGVEAGTAEASETAERKARFIVALYQIYSRNKAAPTPEQILEDLRSIMAT